MASSGARLVRAFFCLIGLLAASGAVAVAAEFPVRIVVQGGADGSASRQAQLLAEALQRQSGRQFIIDHRDGIGGSSAAAVVARSAADGHVLLFADASLAVRAAGAALAGAADWSLRELAPVGQISSTPLVLAVHPRVPARTLPELLALARSRDVRLQAGTGMAGGLDHLAVALLLPPLTAARIAPFRGDAAATRQLAEGQIDMLFVAAPLALPQWVAGRVRLLAVTAASRNPGLTRLPVLGNAQAEFVSSQWYALFVPATVAPRLVSALQQSMRRALRDEAVTAYFEAHAVDAVSGDTAALEALLRRETERYGSLIRRAAMVP